MSVHAKAKVLTFLAGGTGILKGTIVKPGADNKHVVLTGLATSKNIGIAMNAAAAAEDLVEVALPGGGAKGLLNGTVSFGDHLTADSTGAMIVTTTDHDRVTAIAMEDGVAGDLISVHVVSFIY